VWEAIQSVEALSHPGKYVFHLPWIDRARVAVGDLDLEPLRALLSHPHGYRADFVTPPPDGPYPDFDEELARILATPHDTVRHEIGLTYPDGDVPDAARMFVDDPGAALERLTAALRAYWDVTLAADWPRLRALLEGDLLYRAKRLALEGAEGLFGDLHPAVSWRDGVLSVDKRWDVDVEPGGRGVLLIPVAFSCPKCSVITDPPYQPTLTYTPRAIATLWDTDRAPTEGVLDELVGETRAAILRALEIPMTTTEMASRLGVTPGAVSQQLAMLRRAGVVDAHRSGRGVYSELTPLGASLVELLDA
jgi:DNA-binding transcriptional ArsR family regulator